MSMLNLDTSDEVSAEIVELTGFTLEQLTAAMENLGQGDVASVLRQIPLNLPDRNGDVITKETTFSLPQNMEFDHGDVWLSFPLVMGRLPVEMGNGYVSISTMGISSEDISRVLPKGEMDTLRELLKKLSSPNNSITCGWWDPIGLKAKKQPATKYHRRLHGGRWNKLSRRNGR